MEYRNAIYLEDGRIDCEINHPDYGWIPFTADPQDPEKYGRDIFSEIVRGGSIAPYVPPSLEEVAAQKAEDVRGQRDRLLRDVDALATNPLRWASLTDDQRQEVADYRQALLGVPQQAGFPWDVTWPDEPQLTG